MVNLNKQNIISNVHGKSKDHNPLMLQIVAQIMSQRMSEIIDIKIVSTNNYALCLLHAAAE